MDPQDKGAAPVATDSLLLVRPDIAVEHRDAEARASTDTSSDEPTVDELSPPTKPRVDVVHPNAKTRFYGVKTLNADKIAVVFKNIAEEVIAHLRADANTNLVVRIEIEATHTTGFDEGKVRTVSENARTLKFDQSGFEEL